MNNDNEIRGEAEDRGDEARRAAAEREDGTLEGERGMPSVNTRKSSGKGFLKSVVIMIVGVAALVLLVITVLPKQAPPKRADSGGESQVQNRLPALPAMDDTKPPAPSAVTDAPKPPPSASQPQQQGMTPEQRLMARRQRAPIIAFGGQGQGAGSEGSSGSAPQQGAAAPVADNYGPGLGEPAERPQGRDTLGSQLSPTSTPMAYASILPDRNFLITKGTFLDCALETAINSSVAGFTSCRVTTNVYSDNGRVLLLERGSRITGQYQSGQMKPGLSRIFVLWDRVATPNGVVVDLDSPGIDALGRSGLPGYVNHHFMQRFGAALMLSLVDDYAKYQVAKQQNSQQLQFGDTTSQTQQLAAIALQDSIGIQPTLLKNQGDHIKIYVARDIDFRKVYGLQRN